MKVFWFICSLVTAMPVWAHGDAQHQGSPKPVVMEQKPWGIAATAQTVKRTIDVTMYDRMRFTPDVIDVRKGEHIRFRVRNAGKIKHEMVLGSREELIAHAQLMKRFPNMEHEEPYMVHVAPGESADIFWTFNREGRFEFACLLPGHFDAGMKGALAVRK